MKQKTIRRGGILLVVSLGWMTLAGCRFGNNEVPQSKPQSYTGYYVTQPQKLLLKAIVNGHSVEASGDLALVPRILSQFLTNPVFFGEVDKASGLSGIAPPSDSSRALPVYLSTDGTLAFSGTTKPQTFFIDPLCLSHLAITEKGALHKDPNVQGPAGNKLPLSGSLSLDVLVATEFEGSCQPTFDQLALCYSDATQCGGSDATDDEALQAAVISVFSPFIGAHLLNPSDIANVTQYAYEVSYE